MFQYEHIEIVQMDPEKTVAYEDTDVIGAYLSLSRSPDASWIEDFNSTWSNETLGLMRPATIQRGGIVIQCLPEELEEYMPRLRRVVAEVGQRHFETAKDAYERTQAKSKASAKQRAEIEELARRINK